MADQIEHVARSLNSFSLWYRRYDSLFRWAGVNWEVKPELIKAVAIVESGLRPDATSPKGAVGLMQFTPAAFQDAKRFGVIPPDADPRNPEESIKAAAAYLAWLFQRFRSLDRAVAAYNAGPGRIGRILERHPGPEWVNFLPTETRAYVRKVLTELEKIEAAKEFEA